MVRAEPELAVAEADERRAAPRAPGPEVVLVSGAVHPEILVLHEALRVGEQHDTGGERAEAELVLHEQLAHAPDRATAVTEAELRRDDEQIEALLLLDELLEHLHRASRLPEVLRAELPLAVVVELAGLRDLREHDLHGPTVRGRDLLPRRDDEVALGHLDQRAVAQLLVHGADAGEEAVQDAGLLDDGLRSLVLGRVDAA